MKREYDFSRGRRGPVVPLEPGKTRITIRLDNTVLDHFRKRVHEMGGGNYQSLINEALREHIRRGGIEAAVRRAVREELKGAGLKRAAGNGGRD
jgi:BrnA antitoxin of type II toxin-antitoxin system